MAKRIDKKILEEWELLGESIANATPIDLSDSPKQIEERKKRLEKDDEAWFAYYLPIYYKCEPAPFHKRATKRVMQNPEWFEVRSWSRELAKSARTMMEVIKLCLTVGNRNVLLVSNSYDNAERLLEPYKITFEKNNRIIQDYGIQQKIGSWETGEFVTKGKNSFRALGAGQSPRGTRNEDIRPNIILIDDIDTDEECRNADIIKKKVEWIFGALFGTRSVSEACLIIACGNIIAKYCCITELAKKADKHDIINIVDNQNQSTWPQKNSDENIARIKKINSHDSFEKEYMNNPIQRGEVFEEIYYDKLPPVHKCERVVIYADPSVSNRTSSKSSQKSLSITGNIGMQFYIYKVWTDNATHATFIDWFFDAKKWLDDRKVIGYKMYIENNSLQNDFYVSVFHPLIKKKEQLLGFRLGLKLDTQKKPEKFARIEARLEPLNRAGDLIFNIEEKNNPHMERCESQFLGCSPTAKILDAPDSIEGGISLMEKNIVSKTSTYRTGKRTSFRE